SKIALLQEEEWLKDYESHFVNRVNRYHDAMREIESMNGSILDFARIHEYYGIHFDENRNGWVYREWAPAAHQLYFFGDFNNWNRSSHPMTRDAWGNWEIFLPHNKYKD